MESDALDPHRTLSAVRAFLLERLWAPPELAAVALRLAELLDSPLTQGPAAIAKELRATLAAIDAAKPADGSTVVEQLAANTAARRAEAEGLEFTTEG